MHAVSIFVRYLHPQLALEEELSSKKAHSSPWVMQSGAAGAMAFSLLLGAG